MPNPDLHQDQTGRPLVMTLGADLQRVVPQPVGSDPDQSCLEGWATCGARGAGLLLRPHQLHPDTAAHRLIGKRFGDCVLIRTLLEPATTPGWSSTAGSD